MISFLHGDVILQADVFQHESMDTVTLPMLPQRTTMEGLLAGSTSHDGRHAVGKAGGFGCFRYAALLLHTCTSLMACTAVGEHACRDESKCVTHVIYIR